MIGTDSHKRAHTVVTVDEVGCKLDEKTVRTNGEGHLGLEGDLLAAGRRVVRVQTRLMATARRAGRRPGKSDPIDAEAVALAA